MHEKSFITFDYCVRFTTLGGRQSLPCESARNTKKNRKKLSIFMFTVAFFSHFTHRHRASLLCTPQNACRPYVQRAAIRN